MHLGAGPKRVGGKETNHCHIDDQHCLQAALLREGAALQWSLDTNATMFLNLLGVAEADLERRDGRCFYKPTGRAPCVLHSNGKMAKPKMAQVFTCMPDNAWVVPATTRSTGARGNLSAALLFPTTH